MKILQSDNFEETQKIGEDFAKDIKSGKTILLYGDLGNGKTTFVQGLARGLGITKRIISPTFVIMRTHKISKGRVKNFFHLDLYRIEGKSDLKNLGIEEILGDKDSIVVIEWSEKLKYIPKNSIKIEIENKGENKRLLKINE